VPGAEKGYPPRRARRHGEIIADVDCKCGLQIKCVLKLQEKNAKNLRAAGVNYGGGNVQHFYFSFYGRKIFFHVPEIREGILVL
jgi:hypothetical protein